MDSQPNGLFMRIARVMGKVQAVSENETHGQGWKYAGDKAIYDAVRPYLAEEGLAIIPSISQISDDNGKMRVMFDMKLICGETGEILSSQWAAESFSKDDKGVNKCATVAMKYFLKTTFLIATGDPNDDGDSNIAPKNSNSQSRNQQPSPERKAQPKSAPPGQSNQQPDPNGEPPATRATLSPDKLVNTLKTKAANIEVEVQKADNGTIMYISTKDAQALARDMESIMLTKTRKWILSQAFETETCTELNHRQAAAVSAWLKDKAAARLDAEGVKAFLERTNAPDDAAAEFANI
jgi:predicted transcriptional regulator